jgi:NAD+ kinase
MSNGFQRIGIVGKQNDPEVRDAVLALVEYLRQGHYDILVEELTARYLGNATLPSTPLPVVARCSDLVIAVGGDGTLLHAARSVAEHNVPVLGVNLGRLGFLADVSPVSMQATLSQILAGQYQEEERFLLRASIGSPTGATHSIRALNDIVVHKWNVARMVKFEVYINDRFIDAQSSDGLIVATPTGSTAYALSGGGPLLDPGLNAIVLVPVCPHTLSSRPIVITGDSRIDIHICSPHHEHVRVTCDGRTNMSPVGQNECVSIVQDEHRVRFVHPSGYDHFDILRAKLGWGERPRR